MERHETKGVDILFLFPWLRYFMKSITNRVSFTVDDEDVNGDGDDSNIDSNKDKSKEGWYS